MGKKKRRKKEEEEAVPYLSGADMIKMAQQNAQKIQKRVSSIAERGVEEMKKLSAHSLGVQKRVSGMIVGVAEIERTRKLPAQLPQLPTTGVSVEIFRKSGVTIGSKATIGQTKEVRKESEIGELIRTAQQNAQKIQKRASSTMDEITRRGIEQMKKLGAEQLPRPPITGVSMEAYRRSREIISRIEKAKTEKEIEKHMREFFKTIGGWRNIALPFGRPGGYYTWCISRSKLMANITKMMLGKPYASFYYAEPPLKGNLPHWQKQRAISFYLGEKGDIQRLVVTGKVEERAKMVARALRQLPIKIKAEPGSEGYLQWRNPKTGMWEKLDIATRTIVARSPTKFPGVEVWKGKR